MWQSPSVGDLMQRAADRRYENNLEVYLCKIPERSEGSVCVTGPSLRSGIEVRSGIGLALFLQKLRFHLVRPPALWFDYDETKTIGPFARYQLWRRHIQHVFGESATVDDLIKTLPLATSQRLARLGAILPGQVREVSLREKLLAPMVKSMPTPKLLPPPSLADTAVADLCRNILINKNALTEPLLKQVLRRLAKASQ